MLDPAWVAALRTEPCRLRDPVCWILLLGSLAVGAALAFLIVLAVHYHHSFLRLRPVMCLDGVPNQQLLVIVLRAPLAGVFLLLSLGEAWSQLERRRVGRPTHWRHAWGYWLLASALGALLLVQLGC